MDHELVSHVVRHLHEREADGALYVQQVVYLLTPVGAPGSRAQEEQEAVWVQRKHDVAQSGGAQLIFVVGAVPYGDGGIAG
ncbi:hypothetical protein [Streptomyces sp. 039-1]|uniref:hypothetical protein n=1 Tax=Streptomyces sp. 039-1 TaxID=2789263 RepID=UPI0039F4755A